MGNEDRRSRPPGEGDPRDSGEGEPPTGRYGLSWPGKEACFREADLPFSGAAVLDAGRSRGPLATCHAIYEGDNLDVLRLLRDRGERFRLIYIDPPYNTGGDFTFRDSFRPAPDDSEDSFRPASDGGRDRALPAPRDTAGPPDRGSRRHARWLSMIAPRLAVARSLLEDGGFLAVSIGEEEMANLKCVLNELFGEENHRNTIAVRRHDKNLSRQFMEKGLFSLAVGFEYVLVYARSPLAVMNPVFRKADDRRRSSGYWKGFWNAADRPTMRYPLLGVTPVEGQWKWAREKALEAVASYEAFREESRRTGIRLEDHWVAAGKSMRYIRRNPAGRGRNLGVEHWVPPGDGILRTSDWTDRLAGGSLRSLGIPFDNPKSVDLIKALVRCLSGPGDRILDFFAGSGTTAHAVLEMNREDGGRRAYTLAQAAEPVNPKSAAARAGFATVADLLAARLDRVIERLERAAAPPSLSDDPGAEPEDLGFRYYRVTAGF